ncbi:hypothetical protein G6F65_019795 [Rhizopus arrhizus]|nr:hypothetical protein G6F65_019795 [Rhizopus arrhizus]
MHFGNGRAHLQAGIDLPWIVGVQLLAPPLGTGGEADLTGPGVAQAAGNLRVDALQLGLGRTQGGDVDRITHRLRRGCRVEQVVAAGGQCIGQRPAVGEATGHALALAAARPERGHFPVPLRGGATQAEHAAIGGGTVGLEGAAKVEEAATTPARPGHCPRSVRSARFPE